MRIYVATSWRNTYHQEVVEFLREAGFSVYDFKKNPARFSWADVNENWENWTKEQVRVNLKHPVAMQAFEHDRKEMESCEACVLVHPCGASAHLEAGWFVGQGKKVVVLLDDGAPDLMLNLCAILVSELELVPQALRA